MCLTHYFKHTTLYIFDNPKLISAPGAHSSKYGNHINRIHEIAFRIVVYQDHDSTFDELLAKDGYFKILDRNLQKLLIEIFKVKMKVAPEMMNEVFDIIECPYPFRNELRFKSQNLRTVK